MKYTSKKPHEIIISQLQIVAPVWYDEEEIPNNFPGRTGQVWVADILIDTGEILNWPKGRAKESIHLTVKDGGVYILLGPITEEPCIKEHARLEDGYVPHCLIPGKYGDTIEIDIENGIITNWPKQPNLARFFGEKEED